ncbi:MAG: GNAT family N-acetyltransferase [Solirubrobacterales bacterium]
MSAIVTDNTDARRYEIFLDDEFAGFAEYRRQPGIIAFVDTQIDPAFEGRELGGELVSRVLDEIAEHGLDVLPFCPIVNEYVDDHPHYLRLVPPDMRDKFGLTVD